MQQLWSKSNITESDSQEETKETKFNEEHEKSKKYETTQSNNFTSEWNL